jgi:hypothetical protein
MSGELGVELTITKSIDFGALTNGAVEKFLNRAVLDVHRFVTQNAPSDTARLKTSLQIGGDQSLTEVHGAEWARVGTRLPYGYVLEKGRKPGGKMPPKDVLLPWMHRHGIPPEDEFGVRLAIKQKGIMQYVGWFSSGVEQGLKKADTWLTELGAQIKSGWEDSQR